MARNLTVRMKACHRCHQPQDWRNFTLLPTGRRDRFCQGCRKQYEIDKQTVYRHSAGPCAHCGKSMLVRYPSRAKTQKYCGFACSDAGRSQPRNCPRCGVMKRAEEFQRSAETYNRRRRVCRECFSEYQVKPLFGTFRHLAPTLSFLIESARARARTWKQPFTAKRQEVKKLCSRGCELCGDVPTTVRMKDKNSPANIENLRAVCRFCCRLLKTRSLEDMVLIAKRIAHHHRNQGESHAPANARRDFKPAAASTLAPTASPLRPLASGGHR